MRSTRRARVKVMGCQSPWKAAWKESKASALSPGRMRCPGEQSPWLSRLYLTAFFPSGVLGPRDLEPLILLWSRWASLRIDLTPLVLFVRCFDSVVMDADPLRIGPGASPPLSLRARRRARLIYLKSS